MEEDNKVWLGLGEDQIDQSLFLTNAANNIQSYVQSKPWSAKRKQSFLNAYNAIMQTGVTGATNNTGQWELTTQTQLDPSGLSNRDQEMLGDAAYFILSQMQEVTPRGTTETTEEPSKEKTKFVSATAFDNWISNNKFGGREYSRPDDWNILDERDATTGKRGTANRMERMKQWLTEFRDSLNDNDWDYTDNPTDKNTAEVQAKINAAINALDGKTEVDQDVIDTLNALGLNHRVWFDNGLGEDSGKTDANGNPLTWQQWQEQQAEDAKLKAEADAAKLKAQNEAIKASPWSKTLVHKYSNPTWNDNEFANQLGNRNLIDVLNEYASKMNQLNSGQRKFVHSAYRSGIPKVTISDEEYNILKNTPAFRNAPKSRFSKIAGVDGLIYDNSTQSLLSPLSMGGESSSVDPNEWIHGQSSEVLKEKTKNTPRGQGIQLTAKDKADLSAIAMDFAALIDWEPYSAGTLGVAAGVTRSVANWDKDRFWKSLGTSAFDVGTGALSFLPVAGDTINGYKIIKGFKAVAPLMAGVFAVGSFPEAKKAWDKIDFEHPMDSAKKLTPEDYRALFNVVQGLMTGRAHIRGNLAQRRVLQHTGHNVSNSRLQRLGITKTEVKTEVEVPTLRTKVNGKEVDFELDKSTQKELENLFNKHKGNREAAIKEYGNNHPEFKEKLKKAGLDVDNMKAEDWEVIKSNSLVNKGREYLGKYGRKTSDSFGTTSKTSQSKTNDFEEWLAGRSNWNKFKYGSNRTMRQIAEARGINTVKSPESEVEKASRTAEKAQASVTKRETPLSEKEAQELKENVKSWRQEYKNILNTRKSEGRNYEWSKHDVGTDKLKSSVKIGNKNINIEVGSDGVLVINGEKTNINGFGPHTKDSGKRAVRQRIKETVLQAMKQERVKKNTAEFEKTIQELRKLKAAGFLKQGGNINLDTTISNFLKNQK